MEPPFGRSPVQRSNAVNSMKTGTDENTRRQSCLLRSLLVVLTLVTYGWNFTHSQGEFIDAPHHLLNGIFVLDASHDPVAAISNPMSFGFNYYQHFPAVNIGYYPPVFPIAEAAIMSVVGVSAAAGQLTVLLFAVLATLFSFAWFRLRFDDFWAAAATALLMLTPYLVYWGRDIMLEIPVLALLMGAMYWFERLLRTERAGWGECLIWALLTMLAMWTKQHALMLLGIFAVGMLTTGRWRHLVNPAILTGVGLLVFSAVILVLVQVKLGGDAVGHSVGFTAQHVADRFNWNQWNYYLRRFPEVVDWPVLVAAAFGLVATLYRRPPYFSALLVWPVLFYFMHSYMKAQDIRYAILVVPPVIALAVMGIRGLSFRSVEKRDLDKSRGDFVPRLAMAALLAYSVIGVYRVNVPRVSSAYSRAAEELVDRLGPHTCLTFVPERAARPAVMHRLAVESSRCAGKEIYSFGRILRANQVLWDWPQRWPDATAVSAELVEWNVKFLLIESPAPLDNQGSEAAIQALLDDLAAREFKLVAEYPVDLTERRWPVRISNNDFPHRKLRLFERTAPMEFNPKADPPISPQRIPMTISG